MKVIALPVTEQRSQEVRAALTLAERALNELLRRAVVESRQARTRLSTSPAGALHLRASSAYLEGVAVILEKPGVEDHLAFRLAAGEFDIRKLAAAARSWTGPEDPDVPKVA